MEMMSAIVNVYWLCLILLKSSWYRCESCQKNFIPFSDVTDAVRVCEKARYDARVGDIILHTGFTVTKIETASYRKHKQMVLIADKNATTIVAFRGTKAPTQLLEYLKDYLAHVTKPDRRPHLIFQNKTVTVLKYFIDAVNLLYPKIRNHLTDRNRKYIITGHSSGGSLASIVALKLKEEKTGAWVNQGSALITFGAPRVGDARYATLHDEMIPFYRKLRFTRHGDVIPNLPPRPFFFHHSREVFEERKRKITWGGIKSRYFFQICPKDKDFHVKLTDAKTAFLFVFRTFSIHKSYEKYVTATPRVYKDETDSIKPSWKSAWDASC